jgi:hypothetical protein
MGNTHGRRHADYYPGNEEIEPGKPLCQPSLRIFRLARHTGYRFGFIDKIFHNRGIIS